MDATALAALTNFNIFLDGISAHCSEPVNMSEREVQEYMEKIRQSPNAIGEFYMVGDVTTVNIKHQVNSEKFLPLGLIFTADEYIALIHPDYLVGYLRWAMACYSFIDEVANMHAPLALGMYFRITFPLRYKDGNFYWTLMDAVPLQVDKNNYMLTHLNRYVKLNVFGSAPKYQLQGEILGNNHFNAPQWMQALYAKMARRADAFSRLTPAEKKILLCIFRQPSKTVKEIAQALQKDEETVKRQRKSILLKAKENFPKMDVKNMKELVSFLEPYGYFDTLQ